MRTIVIGITGASGSVYAVRLVEELLQRDIDLRVICTGNGRKVMKYETSLDVDEWVRGLSGKRGHIQLDDVDDLFSPVASGSSRFDALIVVPCSMATLAEISNGVGKNLLCRAADVAMKEGREVVLVPRETPLSAIHLENMLKLSRLGVTILPAMPGFYHRPQTKDDLIDFVVGKVLDHLRIENQLFTKWDERK